MELFWEDSLFFKLDERRLRKINPTNYECINTRANKIIYENKKLIKWKTVLDLWCNNWLFSYACLKVWAKSVHWIDWESKQIELANFIFEDYNIDKTKYSFEKADIIDFLTDCKEKYDVVLVLWVIYFIKETFTLFKLISKVTKRNLIIDTFSEYWLMYNLWKNNNSNEINYLYNKPSNHFNSSVWHITYTYRTSNLMWYNVWRTNNKHIKPDSILWVFIPKKMLRTILWENYFDVKFIDCSDFYEKELTMKESIDKATNDNFHWSDIYANRSRYILICRKNNT